MRFSLRNLLLFVACCAVALTALLWATREYRRQLNIRRHLESRGAGWVNFTRTESTYQTNVGFFQPISNELDEFRELGKVEFKCFRVTADTIAKLESVEHIEHIFFISCDINDEDIHPLANVSSVSGLLFWNANISDESIKTIAKIPGLQSVAFINTAVTAEGVEALKVARPEVEVFRRSLP